MKFSERFISFEYTLYRPLTFKYYVCGFLNAAYWKRMYNLSRWAQHQIWMPAGRLNTFGRWTIWTSVGHPPDVQTCSERPRCCPQWVDVNRINILFQITNQRYYPKLNCFAFRFNTSRSRHFNSDVVTSQWSKYRPNLASNCGWVIFLIKFW